MTELQIGDLLQHEWEEQYPDSWIYAGTGHLTPTNVVNDMVELVRI
jgi:hypothetical protein